MCSLSAKDKRLLGPINVRNQSERRYLYRTGQGFELRRLMQDHGAPAVRFPREIVRNLGWMKGDLLWVTMVDDVIVIGKLRYEDPMEVANDKANEARWLVSNYRTENNTESGTGRNGNASSRRSGQ